MTNIPYEERIKNRSNDWYYNKCIRQYHFIIKSEGANQRYKEEIKRLNNIIDEFKEEIKISIKSMSLKSSESSLIIKSTLEIILDRLQELKEEGKE